MTDTPDINGGANAEAVARDSLKSFVQRIENLEEEKAALATDIKDVYGEAKATGFDTKVLKKVIAIRKMERDQYLEQKALLETYMTALGIFG